ncbi:MAG TPA: hypothetical protein VMG09_13085 [Bacteroidota bacterium]|nr:hypothetical protein [Bacteroidota bacterium]
MKSLVPVVVVCCVCIGISVERASAQAELAAWGNLTGIRIEGQLMKVPTSICLIGPSMGEIVRTEKEHQRPLYKREGNRQIVTTEMSKFQFTVTVNDTGKGRAGLDVRTVAVKDTTLSGVFLCFEIPVEEYPDARITLLDSTASSMEPVPLIPKRFGRMPPGFPRRAFLEQATVHGFRVESTEQNLEVRSEQPAELLLLKGNPRFGNPNPQLFLSLMVGPDTNGQTSERSFQVRVSGKIDQSPVRVTIDPESPGRKFDGLGGNFRLQNGMLDSSIIDYCLNNLNVRWARVEMPWRNWHPIESNDPLEAARDGKLDPGARGAMEMTQRLARRHIPIIVSAWYPPVWAISGEPNFRNENGIFGNPLNPRKMRSIIKSIGDYFVYLKEAFGVEPDLFSFNESDLGINVRMTGQEHAEFIKKLGAYLASRELSTKMLLGDNSDATTIDFIQPALDDPATHQYIGAISFHAWRGCDNWTLANWADASRELNAPLLIAEGGTDAQAHQYPDVFLEPSFAQDEIDIYVRACNVAHVRSILQWQLTSDYSLLTGGGVEGTQGPLRPTQRFWNLKQLGLVAPGSFILPTKCTKEAVSCAAFGDIADSIFTIDFVNSGASRTVILSGVPETVREFRTYVTDNKRGMQEEKTIRVSDGQAKFTIDEFCFTTLVSVGR